MNKIVLFIVYLFPIIIILTYKNKNKYMFTLIYIITVSSIFVMNKEMDDTIQTIKYKNDKIKNIMIIANNNNKIDDKKSEKQNIVYKDNLEKETKNNDFQVQVTNVDKIYNKDLKKNQAEVIDNQNNTKDVEKEKVNELQIFNGFKKEIQDIEKKGLVPLRKCYGVLKKLQKGKANMDDLRKAAQNSRQKCEQAELMYKNLKVPEFEDKENTKLLQDAKLDIQKAFYIRKKAMDYGIEFLDKKSPKYIIKTKDNIKLSDKLIHSCVDKMNKVKINIKNSSTR
ncbi:MAG: hypothetical protein N4A48_05105 [Tepidibacter sp.]|uniref:hypothetical protein n=1 Tax=Tepidibacter sp. TaxID=2529387 RepID=UPI0025D34BA8|nr:hypothetical protein [Tepidibacter sp.]MCT4508131.1 hypothetical protein [Tepidibacter sp.]